MRVCVCVRARLSLSFEIFDTIDAISISHWRNHGIAGRARRERNANLPAQVASDGEALIIGDHQRPFLTPPTKEMVDVSSPSFSEINR